MASDHAGFPLKARIMDVVRAAGHEVLDCGPDREIPGDDYPDYAERVARAVLEGRAARAVLVCGSGIGASVAASKFPGIRAALCHDTYSAHQGVEHDDMNVLCLGSRVIGPALSDELVRAFVAASFTGEARHERRLAKIRAFEIAAMNSALLSRGGGL
ncbi:MAG TPA: RpiB/LacA/LacB family sugar-phosphate isomerase [Gemmatimonadaceae bacterium]|nr:RpiB/LacA/LacB family sugar-phosphate isomerase [Gemmatimonadaceae bacterium]